MNRCAACIAIVAFLFIGRPLPLQAASGLIFEGKVADADGRPVPGAEIRILDAAGRARYHVYSDMAGGYRFPLILIPSGNAQPYKIAISHLRYYPITVADALGGARLSRPGPADVVPGVSPVLLASLQIVERDFSLKPSPGVPQHPNLGPFDPNFAEYCYQQAHLLIDSRRVREAVEYLKIYAQIGGNRRQIARSLALLAMHDR